MNHIEAEFRRRWNELDMHGDHDLPNWEVWLEVLVGLYSGTARHYHNMRHIVEMLELLDDLATAVGISKYRKSDLALAVFFHDAIFVPGAPHGQNERQSGLLLTSMMHDVGLCLPGSSYAENLREKIAGTIHPIPLTASPDQVLMADLDLASLGYDSDRFESNSWDVYMEYHDTLGTCWEKFREGRKEFFKPFLERPSIYCTPYFRERFEKQARINLESLR